MGLEPAFSNGGKVWPLAGLHPLRAEPDDPGFTIPAGALVPGQRDRAEPIILRDTSSRLDQGPVEPLDISRSRPPERGRKWRYALLASCIFHAAVAMFFISAVNDEVLLEGAEQAGIMMQGSAPEDQVSAGEMAELADVTNVTLITMLDAAPVETVEAQAVPVEDVTASVETVEAVTAAAEMIETVEEEPAEPVVEQTAEPAIATPIEPVPETATPADASPTEAPVAHTSPAEPATDTPPTTLAYAAPAPEVLAADTLEPVEDDNVVQKPSEIVTAEPVEPAEAAPTQTKDVVPAEAEPEPAEPPPPETAPKPIEKKAEKPIEEKPTPKKVEAKPEPRKKAEPRPANAAAIAKPDKPAPKKKQKSMAGNGGQNPGDAKRGAPDGEAKGNTTAKSKGKASSVGNASVSNYPGKVLAKLRRSLRGIPRSAISRARNDVQVSFVVSASGEVGSVRISRSSGSPELDSAALAVVRRAAPFPPIPPEAGRSNWQFTLPLGLAR